MPLLFNPGPTNVSRNVWSALNCGDICHREREFSECLAELRSRLLTIVRGSTTHDAVAFGCSATGCHEAVFNSVSGPIILVSNGKYSERLGEIARRAGLTVKTLRLPADRSPTEAELADVEQCLSERDNHRYVAFVHHETTTGSVAPLSRFGLAAARGGKSLIVDTVSSFGILDIDVNRDNIAFCTTSSNKGLQSLPGMGFVVGRVSDLEAAEKVSSRSFYFDLPAEWRQQQAGQTRFTPPVQIAYACCAAVNELLEEGVVNRRKRYEDNASHLRDGLEKLGYTLFSDFGGESPIVTTVSLEGIEYSHLHHALKSRGVTIYSDSGTLARGYFRIATMGAIERRDIDRLLMLMQEYREEHVGSQA